MAFEFPAISPRREMVAFETLAARKRTTPRSISRRLVEKNLLPSELLQLRPRSAPIPPNLAQNVERILAKVRISFSVSIFQDFQYPSALRDAQHPLPLFYFRGDVGLLSSRCVSVVGTRTASEAGETRARKIARTLVENGYTVVSGLARGIDTAAMVAAIKAKGYVVGVIGTPIDQAYPRENAGLQELVARNHLLVSEVPFVRYATQDRKLRRQYFPARNETMSALTEATIIVEASETTGTLTQARAALKQGRRLFIHQACFEEKNITWPKRFEARGATRFRDEKELMQHLGRIRRASQADL